MNIFSWKGRINRLPYFIVNFLCVVVFYGLFVSIAFMPENLTSILITVMPIAYLVIIYIQICYVIKRLHDIGRPGVHIFLALIPLYNIYFALLLLFQEGENDSNAYGENPLKQI